MKSSKRFTAILLLSSTLFFPSSFADDSDPGEFCPRNWESKGHRDHCAHEGKPFRDRDGAPCAGTGLSPIDGIHTSEVRMGTLTECFGKDPRGEDYLLCVARYVDAYYQTCPHYKGLF